jgi:hypothetical protein
MVKYDIETTDFALSPDGVHLLRNRFNFKTLPYHELDRIILKRGVEIKNATVTLILGVMLTLFAVYQCKWVIDIFNNSRIHRISIESIVVIIFPMLLGVYCIFVALKKAPILQVKGKSTVYKLRLKEVVKRNETLQLIQYLQSKLKHRLVIKEDI